jgi:hypothetical protein
MKVKRTDQIQFQFRIMWINAEHRNVANIHNKVSVQRLNMTNLDRRI